MGLLATETVEHEDEEAVDFRPLFEERLVDRAAEYVTFDFGTNVLPVTIRQRPSAFHREVHCEEKSIIASSPTERACRTGCFVWDAAVVLAALLVKRGCALQEELQPGSVVVELGSGETGLVGIALARALKCAASPPALRCFPQTACALRLLDGSSTMR